MSTYGTAVAMDVAPDGDPDAVALALRGWRPSREVLGRSGWTRFVGATPEVGRVDEVRHALAAAGKGCAALAEDNDEYGALWLVLAVRPGELRTVHRRYVLNADPRLSREVALAVAELGTDPRQWDVAGPEAATEAASLFGVDPTAMVAAEAASGRLHERLMVVGGAFPWWPALGLVWPGSQDQGPGTT